MSWPFFLIHSSALEDSQRASSLSQRRSLDLKPLFCQEFSKNSYSFRNLLLIYFSAMFSVRLIILPCNMQDNHDCIFFKGIQSRLANIIVPKYAKIQQGRTCSS